MTSPGQVPENADEWLAILACIVSIPDSTYRALIKNIRGQELSSKPYICKLYRKTKENPKQAYYYGYGALGSTKDEAHKNLVEWFEQRACQVLGGLVKSEYEYIKEMQLEGTKTMFGHDNSYKGLKDELNYYKEVKKENVKLWRDELRRRWGYAGDGRMESTVARWTRKAFNMFPPFM